MAARVTGIQSVHRAFDLLEALTLRDELGLVELAEHAQLTPSTAHRLLATLAERGYVTQNPDSGRYLLSYKVLQLAGVVARRGSRLLALARPHLERVRDATGETANLVVLDAGLAVYVDQAESPRPIRLFTEAGRGFAPHTTAAGKAMLAAGADAAPKLGERLTRRTIVSPEALVRELERTRRRGYAVDNEEHEEGVLCVAAAVMGHDGLPAAAISVSAPALRLRRSGIARLGELVQREAHALSLELGHDGGPASAATVTQ
jgi:DNA-binding IclR family transcriptional regulator